MLGAAEGERDWRSQPILLIRHGHACEQLKQGYDALQSWFRLCWLFPGQADCIDTLANQTLREKWRQFYELDPDLPTETFPAWLVAVTPGLFRMLPEFDASDSVCPASYGTILALQKMAGHQNAEQKLRLRGLLKKQDPILFEHYMAELCHA